MSDGPEEQTAPKATSNEPASDAAAVPHSAREKSDASPVPASRPEAVDEDSAQAESTGPDTIEGASGGGKAASDQALVKQNKRSGREESGRSLISPMAMQLGQTRKQQATTRASRKRRRLNGSLFLGITIAVLASTVAVHLLHSYQVERSAVTLHEQAERAKADGDDDRRSKYLERYLKYRPNDADASVELALLLVDLANDPRSYNRAYRALEKACQDLPQHQETRQRLIELLISPFGRYQDALNHLAIILDQDPDNGSMYYLRGFCQEAIDQFGDATASYRAAITADPAKIPAYEHLANLLRTHFDQPDEARQLIDRMVLSNPHLMHAHLTRARYLIEVGDTDAAAKDAAVAFGIAPTDIDVLQTAVRLVRTPGTERYLVRDEIVDRLKKLADRGEKDARVYTLLAELGATAVGDPEEAARWLSRGLEVLPGDVTLSITMVSAALRAGDMASARKQIAELEKQKAPDTLIRLLTAEVQLAEHHYHDALEMLEDLRDEVAPETPLGVEINTRLALCYQALSNPQGEVAAYRRALQGLPDNEQLKRQLAEALVRAGENEAALAYLEADETVTAALNVAELRLRDEMQKPAAERSWEAVERALERARAIDPKSPVLVEMRVRLLTLTGDLNQAAEVAAAATEQSPDQLPLWMLRVRIALRSDDQKAAAQLLDVAESRFGNRWEIRLARVGMQMRDSPDEAVPRIAQLVKDADDLAVPERSSLLRRIGSIYLAIGQPADALRVYERVAAESSEDLTDLFRVVTAAIAAEDAVALNAAVMRLKKFEGEEGPYWRYGQAASLVLRVAKGERDQIDEAEQLLDSCVKLRPSWGQAWQLRARVALMKRDIPKALASFAKAFDLGMADPQSVASYAALLAGTSQFETADRVLREFEERSELPLSARMSHLASEVAYRLGNQPRALQYARTASERDPENPNVQRWLAAVESEAGNAGAAESSHRKAVESDPANPLSWLGWIRYLVTADRMDDAKAQIAEMQKKVPANNLSAALAVAYEVTGQFELAKESYLKAVQQAPGNIALARSAVEFYVRQRQFDLAQPIVEDLLKLPAEKIPDPIRLWARRQLAVIVASGDYKGYLRAVALLDENLKVENVQPADIRAKVRLMSQRSGRQQSREAVNLLLRLEQLGALTVSDEILLATQLARVDSQSESDKRWQKLVADHPDRAGILVAYIKELLQQDRIPEATEVLSKLEQIERQSRGTIEVAVAIDLRAGRTAKAVERLQKFLAESSESETELQQSESTLWAGQTLLNPVERGKTAVSDRDLWAVEVETYLQKAAKNIPAGELLLARFLIDEGRVAEGMKLLLAVSKRPGLDAALLLTLTVLSKDRAQDSAILGQADDLAAAIEQDPERRKNVLFAIAAFKEQRGQLPEAIADYREVLQLNPRNVSAQNNLAWLLASRGEDLEEAERLIDQAIERSGPLVELLDTRAEVYLKIGKSTDAVADLEIVVAEDPRPERWIHLAIAEGKAGNPDAARFHLDKALAKGFDLRKLHPSIREQAESLCSDLGVPIPDSQTVPSP